MMFPRRLLKIFFFLQQNWTVSSVKQLLMLHIRIRIRRPLRWISSLMHHFSDHFCKTWPFENAPKNSVPFNWNRKLFFSSVSLWSMMMTSNLMQSCQQKVSTSTFTRCARCPLSSPFWNTRWWWLYSFFQTWYRIINNQLAFAKTMAYFATQQYFGR